MKANIITTCIILFIHLIHLTNAQNAMQLPNSPVAFTDVSVESGMDRRFGKRIKYGGASVSDLDGDGYMDLMFSHHDDRWSQIYFNNGNGTFRLSNHRVWIDGHGYSSFRAAPWQKTQYIIASRGGMNAMLPNSPVLRRVFSNQDVLPLSDNLTEIGFNPLSRGRGRCTLILNLRNYKRRPDVIVFNARFASYTQHPQRVFSIARRHSFVFRNFTDNLDFTKHGNFYGAVTDINNDNHVEVITWSMLAVFQRPINPNNGKPVNFVLKDVSNDVFPVRFDKRGVIGVAELDYNNDGFWDLYIARTNTGELKWLRRTGMADINDRLLTNINGTHYEDRASTANIPQNTESTGVTVGDFNNDGWVDIIISQYAVAHSILLINNKGRGDFIQYKILEREENVAGDQITAVDYDNDGKLDLVVSEGEWFDKSLGGYYRIIQNTATDLGNYLLIRVFNAPKRKAMSLHAVATVCVNGFEVDREDLETVCMKRRVASPGTVVSTSFIEILHFGVGTATSIKSVTVQWVDGSIQQQFDVPANQQIRMGS